MSTTGKPADGKRPAGGDEEPLAQSELGDRDAGGEAGQGGMRSQTETSDDGEFKPS